jgi:hypothetical protein
MDRIQIIEALDEDLRAELSAVEMYTAHAMPTAFQPIPSVEIPLILLH